MKNFIVIIFLFFSFILGENAFAVEVKTNLMNTDLITVKTELEGLYYKASSQKKLTNAELSRLNEIKSNADLYKKDGNTNIVPIYYRLGNTYKAAKKDQEAIECYRNIVIYFPSSPLAKKSLVNLKYYGETVEINGRTHLIDRR